MDLKERNFNSELDFVSTRSSGPGGQNVNKVNSRVTLLFHIDKSQLLSEAEKVTIKNRLAKRITKEGLLQINCQISRSQILNREKAIENFYLLMEKALKPVKKRTPTKPTRVSKIQRLQSKQILSKKKALRKVKPEEE